MVEYCQMGWWYLDDSDAYGRSEVGAEGQWGFDRIEGDLGFIMEGWEDRWEEVWCIAQPWYTCRHRSTLGRDSWMASLVASLGAVHCMPCFLRQ